MKFLYSGKEDVSDIPCFTLMRPVSSPVTTLIPAKFVQPADCCKMTSRVYVLHSLLAQACPGSLGGNECKKFDRFHVRGTDRLPCHTLTSRGKILEVVF